MTALYLVEWSYVDKLNGKLITGARLFSTLGEAHEEIIFRQQMLYNNMCTDSIDRISVSMREVFMDDQDQED